MLLHLLKKDILLAKTTVCVTALMVIAIPLFFIPVVPAMPGYISFLYMVILLEIMLLQAISQMEAKSPKAHALLCAAPYTRKALVQAKYVLFILIFAYCYIVYTLPTLIINPAQLLGFTEILSILFYGVIVYGIYMPFEVKYGLVKAKFVFMVTISVFSIGPTIYINSFANVATVDFAMLAAIPPIVKNVFFALASAAVFSLSMMLSIKIYSKKEL